MRASCEKNDELDKAIEMAIADGVITNNEKKIIEQMSTERGLNYSKVIGDAEKKMSELKNDCETELINHNKKNGNDFEKFVIEKFNKKYFNIIEWAGDKYVNGRYAKTTTQPDILLEFCLKKQKFKFSVECKWRQNFYKGGVSIAKIEQIKRYKDFEKNRDIPVFIAFGVGGKASSPENLYIVPLKEIDNNFILIKDLEKYRKKVEDKFFFDIETKILK